MNRRQSDDRPRSKLNRMARAGGLAFLLIVAAIVAAAWISAGGDPDLPFDYEGFD